MAYPLASTARSAAVRVQLPTPVELSATRSWGRFATYTRSASVFTWGDPSGGAGGSSPPPTTGQLWPRGWR